MSSGVPGRFKGSQTLNDYTDWKRWCNPLEPASLTLGQWNEFRIPRNHLESGRFPVGFRLFDTVFARGHKVPPDIAWAVHGGTPEDHNPGLRCGLDGDAVAGAE